MARGWESKAVEDQIATSADRKADASKQPRTPDELERESQRQGLLLSRAKVVHDMENARDDRHRAALQHALDFIDARMRDL